MIPYVPDFRWLLDREDSVWYPSFMLFRQASLGDWSTVMDRLMLAVRNPAMLFLTDQRLNQCTMGSRLIEDLHAAGNHDGL